MNPGLVGEIVFITGTDTGVGKTVLTALLLDHLRRKGIHALAIKPFCSGSRHDVRVLQKLQPGELSDSEMNPFYFEVPVAPLAAARKLGIAIHSRVVFRRIAQIQSRCELLLIEGAGGLMVPLGKNFLMRDLVLRLRPKVLLVGRNRLGTINHTMLSLYALKDTPNKGLAVILMNQRKEDVSSRTNRKILKDLIAPTGVFSLPFLGDRPEARGAITANGKKIKKTLAAILESV